jgi:hypothetical protein
MIEEECLSDDEWINDFEKDEEKYQEFYNNPVEFIIVIFFYLNKNKEIERKKKIKVNLKKENIFQSRELIGLIMKNKKKTQRIFSILKHNININYENINDYLNSNKDEEETLKEIKNYNDIYFDDSISLFKNINNLLIFVCEKDEPSKCPSKKNRKQIETMIKKEAKNKDIKRIDIKTLKNKKQQKNKTLKNSILKIVR